MLLLVLLTSEFRTNFSDHNGTTKTPVFHSSGQCRSFCSSMLILIMMRLKALETGSDQKIKGCFFSRLNAKNVTWDNNKIFICLCTMTLILSKRVAYVEPTIFSLLCNWTLTEQVLWWHCPPAWWQWLTLWSACLVTMANPVIVHKSDTRLKNVLEFKCGTARMCILCKGLWLTLNIARNTMKGEKVLYKVCIDFSQSSIIQIPLTIYGNGEMSNFCLTLPITLTFLMLKYFTRIDVIFC